ncbi:MAG: efflux RND transporter periplasmic adaptor subunit, partial [Bacteroidota bacterium]
MMSRTRATLLASIALAAISALLLTGCGNGEAKPAGVAPAPAITVRVETLKPRPMIDALHVAGIVKAYEDVMLSPEEGGVVKEWKVEKGRWVSKGDLLVVLKDEVIKASYDAADAQNKMSEMNVEKQKKVYDEQGISELQYRNLQYSRDAAKANADLMRARWERTQLRSPINGVLDDAVFEQGEFAPPGQPIAHIVNLSRMKVQAEIPERSAASITPGTTGILTFDALPGDTVLGTVSFVGSTVSTANRTLLVEISIPNPGGKLKPEMIAKVRLVRKAREQAILVSGNIIQLVDRDRHIVYVERDGRAEERRLTLGGREGNYIEVVA